MLGATRSQLGPAGLVDSVHQPLWWWWLVVGESVGCLSMFLPFWELLSAVLLCGVKLLLWGIIIALVVHKPIFTALRLQTYLGSSMGSSQRNYLLHPCWCEQPIPHRPTIVSWQAESWLDFMCVLFLCLLENIICMCLWRRVFCEITNFSYRTKDYNASSSCKVFPSRPRSVARGIY